MTEIFNLLEAELAAEPLACDGHRFLRKMLGQAVAANLTGFSLYELPPGQSAWPYHYELYREEWVLVVAGEVVVRTPGDDRVLRAGDLACFPPGEEGAHQVRNDSSSVARFAMPASAVTDGFVAIRPDSNTALIIGPGFHRVVPLDEELEFWDREP
jgi:uncharacterized cupin superfamily protein